MTSYQDEDGSWCCWDGMLGVDCGHTAENMPPRKEFDKTIHTRTTRRLLAAERLAEVAEEVYFSIPCGCDGDVWPCASCALRSALSAWKDASK